MITKTGEQYKEAVFGIGTLAKGIQEGIGAGRAAYTNARASKDGVLKSLGAAWDKFKDPVSKAYNAKMGDIWKGERKAFETVPEYWERKGRLEQAAMEAEKQKALLEGAQAKAQGALSKEEIEALQNATRQETLDNLPNKRPWKAIAGTAGATSLGWYLLGPDSTPAVQPTFDRGSYDY